MQINIYDTDKEVDNRMKAFGGKDRSGLKPEIVESLIRILDEHNELVRVFRTARDKLNEGITEFKIQLSMLLGIESTSFLLRELSEQLCFSLM